MASSSNTRATSVPRESYSPSHYPQASEDPASVDLYLHSYPITAFGSWFGKERSHSPLPEPSTSSTHHAPTTVSNPTNVSGQNVSGPSTSGPTVSAPTAASSPTTASASAPSTSGPTVSAPTIPAPTTADRPIAPLKRSTRIRTATKHFDELIQPPAPRRAPSKKPAAPEPAPKPSSRKRSAPVEDELDEREPKKAAKKRSAPSKKPAAPEPAPKPSTRKRSAPVDDELDEREPKRVTRQKSAPKTSAPREPISTETVPKQSRRKKVGEEEAAAANWSSSLLEWVEPPRLAFDELAKPTAAAIAAIRRGERLGKGYVGRPELTAGERRAVSSGRGRGNEAAAITPAEALEYERAFQAKARKREAAERT